MMWYWPHGLSWWGWLGMTAMMVIFWGLVILGLVALVRYYNPSGTRQTPYDQRSTTPESILAERFAGGEIDEQEYRRKREILQPIESMVSEAETAETPGRHNVEVGSR